MDENSFYLGSVVSDFQDEHSIEKKLLRRGNLWVVTDSSGRRVLGRHKKRQDAVRQIAAIESSKRRRGEN